MSLFTELKRRNVFRVGIAYVLGAWVLLQGADFALDVIGAPNWLIQALVALALLGLPVVLVFAWVFEMTPEGLKRETEIDRGQSITPQTGRKLDRVIIILLALAVIVLLADRIISSREPLISISEQQAQEAPVAPSHPTDTAEVLPSIAVLPFVNMSSDPEQEYFSDGLAEELLNRLAKLEQLRVAARTSSFQFKGQNLDVADIGRQLKVGHVLEGSVRKAGNRLRVTAQLIKADDGFHLWSETYERELDDVFTIQDEISGAITQALSLELGMEPASGPPTDNLEGYQLFLQARYLLARRGETNMREAARLFEQSLELDPNFARAWSGLAYTWAMLPSYAATDTQFARRKVEEAAARAVTLDPENPEPYLARARLQSSIDGAIEAAQANFEKAYKLAPDNVDVVNLYGDFLFAIGRLDEAEAMERRAVELDPLDAVHHSDLASLLSARQKHVEAIEFGRTGARLAPDVIERRDTLIVPLINSGRYEEAEQQVERVIVELNDDRGFINSWRCALAYKKGELERLRELVDERVKSSIEGGYDLYSVAAWYALWLDGPQAALPLLRRALEKDEFALTWPTMFFLPEIYSDDAEWLAFWAQPKLVEVIAARRANWNGELVGQWKTPPWQH